MAAGILRVVIGSFDAQNIVLEEVSVITPPRNRVTALRFIGYFTVDVALRWNFDHCDLKLLCSHTLLLAR